MKFDQCMQILSVIGTWVAGIGTVSATTVALYVVFDRDRVKLRGTVGLRKIFPSTPNNDLVLISVTNLGNRPIIVDRVSWVYRRVGKKKPDRIITDNDLLKDCPKKIEYGEEATFCIGPMNANAWLNQFANSLNDAKLMSLRLQVHTTVGTTLNLKPEVAFLQRLKQNLEASKDSNNTT